MSLSAPTRVDPRWLAGVLGDEALHVLDATAILEIPTDGSAHRARSGRDGHRLERIPTAVHADLVDEFSDPSARHLYTAPTATQFEAAVARLGIGADDAVVVYDTSTTMWATRLWWVFRLYGFTNIGVLDGGLNAWRAAGLIVEHGAPRTRPPRVAGAPWSARPRPALLADTTEVRDLLAAGGTCLLSASREDIFRGDGGSGLARDGHIPGSINIPSVSLVGADQRLLPLEQLRRRFTDAGVLDQERIVAYCGGGISATLAAFALAVLGRDDVAVYDGSMRAWSEDEALPMERSVR